jgi:hypothetical protein
VACGNRAHLPEPALTTAYRDPLLLHLGADGPVDAAFQSVFLGAHYNGTVNALLCDASGLSWTGGMFGSIDDGRSMGWRDTLRCGAGPSCR